MKHLSLSRLRRLSIGLAITLFALLPLSLYVTRQTAEAQCGTSTSSCKNCHEVRGEDPVSSNGEWHTAHAFGDFCEFCHAGNVESKTQDEAHVGMVDPLVDVQASCQSCHPQDYNDKAQVYAVALGVQLGAGGGSGGAAAGSNGAASGGSGGAPAAPSGGSQAATTTDAAAATDTTNAVAVESSVSAAPSGQLVDYNVLYAESQAPEQSISTGDLVLLGLIALLLLAFFIALWKFEHWGDHLRHWWQQNILPPNAVAFQGAGSSAQVPMPRLGEVATTTPKPQIIPAAVVATADLEELYRRKPELRQVTPYLMSTDDKTLQALGILLRQPGAGDALVRLSQLDLSLVSALQALSPTDQALLLALAQKR